MSHKRHQALCSFLYHTADPNFVFYSQTSAQFGVYSEPPGPSMHSSHLLSLQPGGLLKCSVVDRIIFMLLTLFLVSFYVCACKAGFFVFISAMTLTTTTERENYWNGKDWNASTGVITLICFSICLFWWLLFCLRNHTKEVPLVHQQRSVKNKHRLFSSKTTGQSKMFKISVCN